MKLSYNLKPLAVAVVAIVASLTTQFAQAEGAKSYKPYSQAGLEYARTSFADDNLFFADYSGQGEDLALVAKFQLANGLQFGGRVLNGDLDDSGDKRDIEASHYFAAFRYNAFSLRLTRFETSLDTQDFSFTTLGVSREWRNDVTQGSWVFNLPVGGSDGLAWEYQQTWFVEKNFGIGFALRTAAAEDEDTDVDMRLSSAGLLGMYHF